MAGISENVTVSMKKSVLKWFGHFDRMKEKRMAKKIYKARVVDSFRRRPQLTFETLSVSVSSTTEGSIHKLVVLSFF